MTATRFYSSTAGQMFLSGAVSSGAISAVLTTVTGLPASLPYTLLLDPGLATEEVVEVTAIGGTTVTITRAIDGTSAQAHGSGAEVRHGFSARDFQDSRNHEANTTTAHGVTGAVVGTTNTQTLTGKTISGASNTLSAIPSAAVVGLDAHTAATTAHGTAGVIVGTTDVQTLTNKSIDAASNTLTNIPQGAILGQTGTNALVPSGSITMFGAAIAPTGWVNCNGAAVSRTGGNATLFAVIGTTYGVGDGSTTFNVPNFTNNFPVGDTPGTTGGEATHVLTIPEMPSHTHGITFHGGLSPQSVLTQALDGGAGRYDLASGANDWATLGTGGGSAHNNLPPYLGVNFIIKL